MGKFLVKFEEDDRFVSYHPVKPIEIFNCKVGELECTINLSKQLSRTETAPVLSGYLEWLAMCEKELTDYFRLKLEENLPKDWFENIEVYSVDITFLTLEDFGATVSFGESLFPDHIIELYFEEFEIVDEVLLG